MDRTEPDFDALEGAVGAVRRLVTHLRKTTADPDVLSRIEKVASDFADEAVSC